MQVLLDIPDDLAIRFKATVPQKARSAIVAELLAKALPDQDDALFRLALEVEGDPELAEIASDWDGVVGDGIEAR